jgi:hypothetical protein
MCCFSRPVKHVGSTRIFARFLDGVDQCLVYEMKIRADEELAMILPIPVARGTGEDGVKFIDLSGYREFFDDLEKAYPAPVPSLSSMRSNSAGPKPQLAVKRVGAFDASFVPTISDFNRLDARFRLDDAVWKSLPQYKDYGFAVFKLRAGEQHVHPMAFRFPTAMSGRLFFPTVHIHDGKVHAHEEFDHTLYSQAWKNAVISGSDWDESEKNAGQFVDEAKAKDLVWAAGHIYRRSIIGKAKNEDVIAMTRNLG